MGISGQVIGLIMFVIECKREVLSQCFIWSELLAQKQDEFGKDKYSDGG
jgi:hypothetical protein